MLKVIAGSAILFLLMMAAGVIGAHAGRDNMREVIANSCKVGGGFVFKKTYFRCSKSKRPADETD